MAVLACAYGLAKTGSIWYPINLLAATVYTESLRLGPAQLNSFHTESFAFALLLHGIGSIFVGLLYGAMLPMFSHRPIVLGGLIAPVLWYEWRRLLSPFQSPAAVLQASPMMVMLWNAEMGGELAHLEAGSLLKSKMLIGRLFRIALGMSSLEDELDFRRALAWLPRIRFSRLGRGVEHRLRASILR